MLKSVEELREYSLGVAPNIRRAINVALDAIEREIAESYMRLPVDADSIPCNEGDILEWDGGKHEVMAVSESCVWFDTDEHEVKLTCEEARTCRHSTSKRQDISDCEG